MPDRDVEHADLPGVYQTPYEQLCEGQHPSSVARSFERGLKKRLKHFGNETVDFLHQARRLMGRRFPGPLFGDAQTVREAVDELERLAQEEVDNPRAAGIALDACRSILASMDSPEGARKRLISKVYERYAQLLFEKECVGPIRNKPNQHLDIDHDAICSRIDNVVDEIGEVFTWFGRQLASEKNVQDLRVSRQPTMEEDDFDDLNLYELQEGGK